MLLTPSHQTQERLPRPSHHRKGACERTQSCVCFTDAEEACKLGTEREKWTFALARLAARRVHWLMDSSKRASKFSLVFFCLFVFVYACFFHDLSPSHTHANFCYVVMAAMGARKHPECLPEGLQQCFSTSKSQLLWGPSDPFRGGRLRPSENTLKSIAISKVKK